MPLPSHITYREVDMNNDTSTTLGTTIRTAIRGSAGRALFIALAAACVSLVSAPAALAQATNQSPTGGQGPGTAVTQGGSTAGAAQPKSGFSCGAGMSWVVDGGIAKCKVPDAAGVPGATCSGVSNYTAGQCRFDLPAAGHGVTVSAQNTRSGYSGALSITCNNGSWGTPSFTCDGLPSISVQVTPASVTTGSPVTVTWTTTNATSVVYACSGAASYSGSWAINGSTGFATPNVGTVNCTATATGPAGSSTPYAFSWTVNAAAATPANCGGAATVYGNCVISVGFVAHGTSVQGTNVMPGYTGSGSATCFNGTTIWSSLTCSSNSATSNCPATVYSDGSCSYSIPALSHGANGQGNVVAPAGYTGYIYASCNNGSRSYWGNTCTSGGSPGPVPCGGSSTSHGSCAFSVGALADGQSTLVNTYSAGQSGTATATCSSGTVSWSGASCAVSAGPASCPATPNYAYGNCLFDVPLTPSGASAGPISNKAAGYSGSLSGTCSNGTWIGVSATCTSYATDCNPTSTTYGACTYNVPYTPAGATSVGSVVAPGGYTGSLNASCNNGTFSYSGQTCTSPAAACTVGSATVPHGARLISNSPLAIAWFGGIGGTNYMWMTTYRCAPQPNSIIFRIGRGDEFQCTNGVLTSLGGQWACTRNFGDGWEYL